MKNKREEYLAKQPVISAIYQFKQQLHRVLMKKRCRQKITIALLLF